MAKSLQHSEHYFRIISTAQAAQQQAQMGYGRNGEELDEGDDDDDFVALPDRFASPFERAPQTPPAQQPQQSGGQMGYGGGPQPYFERPAFPEQNERQPERSERPERNYERNPNPGGERQERQPRNDRRFGQQGERPVGERQHGQGRNRFRDQQPRFDTTSANQEQPRVDFDAMSSALPAFITAPSRVPALPGPTGASSSPDSDADALSAQSGLPSQSRGIWRPAARMAKIAFICGRAGAVGCVLTRVRKAARPLCRRRAQRTKSLRSFEKTAPHGAVFVISSS